LLGDRGTPPSIAERARIMLAMLTEAELAGVPKPEATPAPKAAPVGEDKAKAKPADKKTK
jgi:hypothetical protein